jgi:uncharacterized membrane protein
MATATKRQTQGASGRAGAQENPARASSQATRQTGQTTQGSLSSTRSDGEQQGALTNVSAEKLARGLGWFSIGLGLAEVLTPRAVAKIAGVRGKNAGLIRLFGLREIASGVAIFAQGRRPAAALWSRVAGDALDLAALGAAFASPRSNKGRVAFATANVLTVTALDILCAQQLSSGDGASQSGGPRATNSLVINKTPEEVYGFWRNFENLPTFMRHLESVRETGAGRSHWVAKAPAGSAVEWDAIITEDRPGELIAWRSLEGADVYNAGSVSFEPAAGGRGTIVKVQIDYDPPAGVVGVAVAWLFGEEPSQQVQSDLRRFKQVLETGEVVVSDATLSGTGLTDQSPAQPKTMSAGR